MFRQVLRTATLAAVCFLPILSACDQGESADKKSAKAPPPPVVRVTKVMSEDLPIVNNLPGRIAATRTAEVRPQVSGIVTKRVFTQGSHVDKGDVLYKIDAASFKVQVASAKANLEKAKAAQLQAEQQTGRAEKLRKRQINSTQDLQNAQATLTQAKASVAEAQASLQSAQLNLQYTDVKAPIAGRIGSAQITEGALVTANGSQSLAMIQQLDPVYADFTQSANDLLKLQSALNVGSLTHPDKDNARQAKVRLVRDDGSRYPQTGRLLFSEATVDSTTGQITLRAEFPNPKGDLLPGMYVRVLIQQGVTKNAIAVPQQAVQRNANGQAQLFTVDDKNTVHLVNVTTGRTLGNRWLIDKGLESDDTVIVEGFQKIQDGATVNPKPWQPNVARNDEGAVAQSGDGRKATGAKQ